MDTQKMLSLRLDAQLLTGCRQAEKTPEDVVRSMCAMQAQAYGMAKWAVGLRLPGCTAADVEEAFQRGEILRTHVLRPTWHFVHPDDIRWLLKLTAPHVHTKNRTMYKKLELDEGVLAKACAAIEKALDDGPRTRPELQRSLLSAGIEAQGHRLSYIMMYAELEGLIASGSRRGKQFTYALMDAVAPECLGYSREEMLGLLAQRYFSSRAPATVHDFSYWSGLSVKDARLGAQALGAGFSTEKIGETEYIVPETALPQHSTETACGNIAFLMPDYDEYGMSYRDRAGLLAFPEEMANESVYSHWLVLNGAIVGTWSPLDGGETDIRLFAQATAQDSSDIDRAKLRYSAFWMG